MALRVSAIDRLPVKINANVESVVEYSDFEFFSMKTIARIHDKNAPRIVEKLKIKPRVMPTKLAWARVSLIKEYFFITKNLPICGAKIDINMPPIRAYWKNGKFNGFE